MLKLFARLHYQTLVSLALMAAMTASLFPFLLTEIDPAMSSPNMMAHLFATGLFIGLSLFTVELTRYTVAAALRGKTLPGTVTRIPMEISATLFKIATAGVLLGLGYAWLDTPTVNTHTLLQTLALYVTLTLVLEGMIRYLRHRDSYTDGLV